MSQRGEGEGAFLRALLDGVSDGFLLTDEQGDVRWASEGALRLLDRGLEEIVGHNTTEFQHPLDAELSRTRRAEAGADRADRWSSMRRVGQRDGTWRTLDCTSIDLRDVPEVDGIVIVLRDAMERHQAWETERRLQALVEGSHDALLVYGADLRVTYANPGVHRLLDDLDGTLLDHIHRFVASDQVEDTLVAYEDLKQPGLTVERLLLLTRTDGVSHWVQVRATNLFHDPAVQGIVLNGRDVTAQVELEETLRRAATRDPLTQLPNRSAMEGVLASALHAHGPGTSVAVLFLDLDRFKVVNDSFGHATGDRLLVELGQRLVEVAGPGATVGRFGGDEFVVVAPVVGAEAAVARADALARAATAPFCFTGADHEQTEVFLSASIGIAIGTGGDEPATLLHHADAAMYRAKERGRGTWELYDEGMRRAALSRLTLEADLARALDDRGFELWYQPIVDVGSGRVRGFESLARWRHRDRGLVSPAEFIPVAEETGGIHRLGGWALATACAQVRAWQAAGLGSMTISVNLSPRQLTREELAADVAELLGGCGIDPSAVCLEITETLLMDDLDLAVKALSRLRDTGVRLALDDFGTGWSSLTYLRSVPVDLVKVDRSFIEGVADSADDRAIVGAVVSMCRALGKEVVAEGVETEGQFRALRELGATMAQGFLFAKPLPAPEVATWLDRYRQAGNRDPDSA